VKRCFQIVVMVLVGALLANSQCYAYCSTAACTSSLAGKTAPCHHHHHRSNGQPENACLHHHSQLSGPQSGTDLAKQAAGIAIQLPSALLSVHSVFIAPAQELWIKLDPAPPPKAKAFYSLSILRI